MRKLLQYLLVGLNVAVLILILAFVISNWRLINLWVMDAKGGIRVLFDSKQTLRLTDKNTDCLSRLKGVVYNGAGFRREVTELRDATRVVLVKWLQRDHVNARESLVDFAIEKGWYSLELNMEDCIGDEKLPVVRRVLVQMIGDAYVGYNVEMSTKVGAMCQQYIREMDGEDGMLLEALKQEHR